LPSQDATRALGSRTAGPRASRESMPLFASSRSCRIPHCLPFVSRREQVPGEDGSALLRS
jgi:hypothetical protein